MTKRRALQVATCAAALLILGPAHASEMLLYGPGVPSPETAARAEAVLRVAADVESPTGGTSHVLDLPFPSQAPVWISGDLLSLPCGDPALAGVDPAAVVSEATELVDELSYDKALVRLEEGLRALPCVAAQVDRKTLTDLYFFLGLAQFEEGRSEKAKRAFASALAIDIDRPWDHDYPPDPQALYEEAAGELIAEGAPAVGLDLRGAALSDFRVDGDALDSSAAKALSLHRGKHLIQYTTAAGTRISSLVNVGRGGGDLVSRDGLRDAVLNLAWKPVTAGAAETALSDLGRSRGVDEVYVVLLDESDDSVDRAYRFVVSTASVLPLSVDSAAVAKEMSGDKRGPALAAAADGVSSEADNAAGRVGIAIGGGLHVGNLNPYGVGVLRLNLRIVGGFEIGAGAMIAGTSVDYVDDAGAAQSGSFLLPGAILEARYRFNPGAAHPYVGGRGIISVSQLEDTAAARAGTEDTISPAGGAGFVVGVDVTPVGTRGFFINVDFLAGYWKNAGAGGGLLLDVVGGVGLRF